MSAIDDFCRAFPDCAELAADCFQLLPLARRRSARIVVDPNPGPSEPRVMIMPWAGRVPSQQLRILERQAASLRAALGVLNADQADATLKDLNRQINARRLREGLPRQGGRPLDATTLLEMLVADLLPGHPPVIHRLWVERLAPELLGAGLTRASQRRRASARRAREKKRAQQPTP